MSNDLIFGAVAVPESNSRLCRTHLGLDLHRRNCGGQIANAHQIVGGACEGENPIHFAHSAMANFAHQRDRLQPTEALFDPLPLSLAEGIPQMPHGAPVNRAAAAASVVLCHMRVTHRFRHSLTKSRVSNPLSPPAVTVFVPGICSSITSAASRSAVPLA